MSNSTKETRIVSRLFTKLTLRRVRIVVLEAPLRYTGAIEYNTDNRGDVGMMRILLQEG